MKPNVFWNQFLYIHLTKLKIKKKSQREHHKGVTQENDNWTIWQKGKTENINKGLNGSSAGHRTLHMPACVPLNFFLRGVFMLNS